MDFSSKLQRYGNWALITGASSGIGQSFAKLLARNGINCVLVSNDQENLIKTQQEIQSFSDRQIEYIVADFKNPEAVDQLLKNASCQRCKIIVNSAGIGAIGYFLEHPLQTYFNIIEIDEKSLLKITHYFCNQFFKNKEKGAIINICSANAELNSAVPCSSVYSAVKSCVKYMTEAIAFEMKPYDIDLLCVSCGPVKSGFQAVAGTRVLSWAETPEQVAEKSLAALGKKYTVITHPRTRWLIRLNKYLWLPKKIRLHLIGRFFGKTLAKEPRSSLKDL